MVSFVVRISIILLWHVATGDKCYLQSGCGNEQLRAVHSTECRGKVKHDIELLCSFNNSNEVLPSDVIYKWEKDGKTMENSSEVIRFTPFKHSDAGRYWCKACSGNVTNICGWINLTTAPYHMDDGIVNNNGDYDCSWRQFVMIEDHCENLLTVDIGGYPPPSLTWAVNDVMATNDSQVMLTILPNGSALVDVQLWSLSDYKDISVIGHNEVGSVGICVWRCVYDDPDPEPIISFELSVTPAELKKGDNDVKVITCSSNAHVGDFYICYSKNLSDLQRLVVNDEHCCYCSSARAYECSQKFPNWELTITSVEQIKQLNCDAVLKSVTEDDVGFYQCRVYDLFKYPCKRRFEGIYNYSISTTNDGSSSNGHFSVPAIAIYGGVAVALLVTIIIITFGMVCWRCRNRHSTYTTRSVTVGGGSEYQPLIRPRRPSENSGNGDEPLPHRGSSDVDNAQVPVQETCDVCGCMALTSPSSQGTRSPFSHSHKAHVIHFGPDAGEWVNSNLTEMLRQMNVEEEYAIAGRFWLSEITRMTKKGYKVIFIVSRDIVTSRFEVMLNQVIFNQNSRKPCLIPILFNCDLNNVDDQLKELLEPYVVLYHYENNLYDRLKLAVCDKCC